MKKMKADSLFSGMVYPVIALWMNCVGVSIAAPQPVLYYNFEEGEGNTVANLGTLGGSGTILNTPNWVTGTPGIDDGGHRFNGNNGYTSANYIDTGILAENMGVYSSSNAAPFTMACWVQGNKTTGDEIVFGQAVGGSNWLHLGLRDRKPHFGLYGDDLQSGTPLTAGTWNHIIYQLNENNVQLIYVNGTEVARRQSSGTGIKLNEKIAIGTSSDANRTVNGPVDDVVIYTNVLSLSQFQFLAAGGDPLNVPDPHPAYDLTFTAPTGTNNTWNLYAVIGYQPDPYLTWFEAYQASTNLFYEGTQGHLVTIHNATEKEFCRYLRNYYGYDTWIGLTDNDTNNLGIELFPGAYESGNTTDVPDVNTRRNNGWVWVNGEPYDSTTYQNWNSGEPNNAPSEDGVLLTSGGGWNDYGSGIPGSGDGAGTRLAIVEWDLNSPVPVSGAIVRDPILPDSSELPASDMKVDGSFVGVCVRDTGTIGDVRTGVARLTSGAGTVVVTNMGISVINACDPDTGNGADMLFPNNNPFFAEVTSCVDSNWVALYRGKIIVPKGEGGLYTFGVHSDDGFALRIPGRNWISVHGLGYIDYGDVDLQTMAYEYGTGDSNSRGIISLPSGTHDIEFITYNGTGGQYHELYAAKGAFTNDADTTTWRLIGYKNIGNIVYAGVKSDWSVWHSENEGVGNLANAWSAVDSYVEANLNQSYWPEINFYDPDSGSAGMLANSLPFPWDTVGTNDDNKALFTLATLVVPADTTIGLGFQGDDGSRLTVSNQTWNTPLVYAINSNSKIVGDSIEHNVGTGNSLTVGSIDLAAGEYPISVLWWEGGGGSYLDVFQQNLDIAGNMLPKNLGVSTYRTLSSTSAEVIYDIDGLQLQRTSRMLIILR